jgi:hypothetical protein
MAAATGCAVAECFGHVHFVVGAWSVITVFHEVLHLHEGLLRRTSWRLGEEERVYEAELWASQVVRFLFESDPCRASVALSRFAAAMDPSNRQKVLRL